MSKIAIAMQGSTRESLCVRHSRTSLKSVDTTVASSPCLDSGGRGSKKAVFYSLVNLQEKQNV
jgi:hypothetical protein